MDYEQFLEQVKDRLQEQFPYMDVSIRSVEKLQGESYTGISIAPAGSNAGATMNLHSQYDLLQEGTPMEIIIRRIENLANDAVEQIPQVDTGVLGDYGQMKDRLIMQAVPTDQNRALLATTPHREMEDLSIVYRFQLDHQARGDATILVTNQMLENYGITAEQLIADAAVSAPQRNPLSIRSMAQVMAEMSGGMFEPEDIGAPALLVATVPGAVNGAGVLGYPDFFKEATELIGGDFFILPSSVHEVLLLADDGTARAAELNAMVSSINASEVMPEDRLSDEAYHYDVKAQVFEKATSYEDRMMEDREMIADAMPGMGIVSEQTASYAVPETMTVLMVEPNRYPEPAEIGTDLAAMQTAVGGNIEVVYPFDEPVGLVMNEEGKINGLPLNRALRDEQGEIYDVVAGPFMVVGLTEDSFGSLTPDQLQKFGEMFHQPEMFMKMGKGIMALPLPDDRVEKPENVADKVTDRAQKDMTQKAGRRKKSDHDGR